jgi:type VI secretion system secreted protein VgrG
MAIEKVEFFASKYTQPLCPQSRVPVGTMLASLELSDVKTTDVNVGTSVRKITLKGEDRPLTAGEIEMARPVFKDSINYDDVKVHKGKFWLTFGLQDDEEAIVPFGKMYFPDSKGGFKEDFSTEVPRFKNWFMHEMTHVWQHQLGMFVLLKALILRINGGYKNDNTGKPPIGYRYDSANYIGKTLPDFNFEQQAEIISHYFAAKYLGDGRYLPDLRFYESVLRDFLVKPKNNRHLPRK